MEYAIAIFVGVWIAVAGLLAYKRISADYKDVNNEQEVKKEDAKR